MPPTQVFAYPRDDGTRIVDHAVEQVTDAPIDFHAMEVSTPCVDMTGFPPKFIITQLPYHTRHAHALLKAALANKLAWESPTAHLIGMGLSNRPSTS
jgi:hypothetical protein